VLVDFAGFTSTLGSLKRAINSLERMKYYLSEYHVPNPTLRNSHSRLTAFWLQNPAVQEKMIC
jgi:hypothetical protein